MSSNDKEVDTKAKALAEGSKESSFSLQSVMAEVKSAQSSLPDFNNMKRQYRAERVSNKSGFKLAPENKMIMGGK